MMEIVSVFDTKMNAYGRPIAVANVRVAIRSFGDELNQASGDLAAHPEDFSLWHIAHFDEETGTFNQFELPQKLVEASVLVSLKNGKAGSVMSAVTEE